MVKAGDSSGDDESSATLRSLLGVSPVSVKPSVPAKPGGRKKLKEKEHSEIREELLEVKQMLANLTAQARL